MLPDCNYDEIMRVEEGPRKLKDSKKDSKKEMKKVRQPNKKILLDRLSAARKQNRL